MTSPFQSRQYQIEAVESIYKYFQKAEDPLKAGNPVIAMPTGTGKSVVIADFLKSVYKQWPSQKIIVLTHVKELIKQNYEKLLLAWPFAPAGIYSAGLNKRDTRSPIVFAGIASVAKRWAEFGFVNLVMIDEAHLLSPNDKTMYQQFLEGLKSINPYLKVIGLTATPYRLGHGKITEAPNEGGKALFDDICFDITGLEAFNRLIAEGYLAPLIPRSTKTMLDTSGVHVRGGEFIPAELQVAVDKESVTRAALNEAMQVASDRNHWLIFSSGVDHAEHIAQMLEQEFDFPIEAVHSKMPSSERDRRIADFQRGKLRGLVNNNILTTGFDSPWIDCIVMLRPTASPVLWVQMLGRGTRPYNGKQMPWAQYDDKPKENCLVLDFANNTRRLGPINDPVVPRRKGEGGGEAPVKLCLTCDTWNHASVRKCFVCGTEFTFEVKIKHEASTVEIIKGDLPKSEKFKVDHVTYRSYSKIGRPPALKVNYFCHLQSFEEYICFEHGGYAAKRARDWWRARTDLPVPETTEEALQLMDALPVATHLRVWTNKKPYPEILAYCFDGTCFNEHTPDEDSPRITVDGAKPISNSQTTRHIDDDIPF